MVRHGNHLRRETFPFGWALSSWPRVWQFWTKPALSQRCISLRDMCDRLQARARCEEAGGSPCFRAEVPAGYEKVPGLPGSHCRARLAMPIMRDAVQARVLPFKYRTASAAASTGHAAVACGALVPVFVARCEVKLQEAKHPVCYNSRRYIQSLGEAAGALLLEQYANATGCGERPFASGFPRPHRRMRSLRAKQYSFVMRVREPWARQSHTRRNPSGLGGNQSLLNHTKLARAMK